MSVFSTALRILLLSIIFLGAVMFISGCSSPQERRGVSNIPFNSPNNQEIRTFEGGR